MMFPLPSLINKTMIISADLLETLSAFAQTLDLGVIAVSDSSNKTITFASKIESILGYKDNDLVGKPFSCILPESVRDRHDKLMEGFKALEGSSTSRGMANGRVVNAVREDKTLVPITIAISYHPGTEKNPSLFLALIKNPETESPTDQFESVQAVFTSLLKPAEQMVKQTRAAIAKKVAATGGIFGFVVWLLAAITPLGTAIKGFVAAWNWQVSTGQQPDDVRVFSGIDEETRLINLVSIRDALREIDPAVLAVAFYKYSYSPTTGKGKVEYRSDSGGVGGEENWFRNFTLDSQQNREILNHECVFVSDQVELRSRPGSIKAGMILCPTFTVGKSEFPHLTEIKSANIAAVSLEPGWTKNEQTDLLETAFWKLATPNIDLNFNPLLDPKDRP